MSETDNNYIRLCEVGKIKPLHASKHLALEQFVTRDKLAACSFEERLTAGMAIFVDMISTENMVVEKVDKLCVDYLITKIDQAIGAQLDEILHHSQFQESESLWRGLDYLLHNIESDVNTKIELLDVKKEELAGDFQEAVDITQSALYKHIYVQEYDTPGGEPISAIVSNYEFNASSMDAGLLKNIGAVAEAAHCPFLGAVGAEFFHKKTLDEVAQIDDLANYMERAEYIHWNALRESAAARYIGLTFPRFLVRLPYGVQNPVRGFCYTEDVVDITARKYLWTSATFAFALNMVRSFQEYGWMLNIRGPESGGKVHDLILHQYDIGLGLETKIPTEILIPETKELEYANLGFIPLSYYKNSDYACFFSANSVQKPELFTVAEATANSRINARLPYVFLTARLGHYLKVLQRENIGTNKNRLELENELNRWLQTLVTKMNRPSPELAASHPLRDGQVFVSEIADNPGFYKVAMSVTPHFQIEGVDVRLTLVGKLPRK